LNFKNDILAMRNIPVLLFIIVLNLNSKAQKRVSFGVSPGSGIHNYQAGLLGEFKVTKFFIYAS